MSSCEYEILRKLRLIEWLKAELVGSVSRVLHAMVKNSEQSIADALASVIVNCYVLGKRVGLDFSNLDEAVNARLEHNIKQEVEIEKWYGDMSELKRYLRNKR